jgi:hypothetical protein
MSLNKADILTQNLKSPAALLGIDKVKSSPRRTNKIKELFTETPGKPKLTPASDPAPDYHDPDQMFEEVEGPAPASVEAQPPQPTDDKPFWL